MNSDIKTFTPFTVNTCNHEQSLVHDFVPSRVDYCNAVFAVALKTITDRHDALATSVEHCKTPNALSVIPGNLTVVCRDSYIPIFIGWTFLDVANTSSVWLYTDASTTKLFGT